MSCALAQLYGYRILADIKILAHNSKKGDVLKLVTVAELTRFVNFEDKFSHVFLFLVQSMYFGYSKEPSPIFRVRIHFFYLRTYLANSAFQ